MHCNSCSNLIENELKGLVTKVSASYSKGIVEVEFDEKKISEKKIIKIIEKAGYKVKGEKSGDSSNDVGFYVMVGTLILLAVFVYKYLSGIGLELPSAGDNTGYLLLFLIGLLTGFHCVSMCGAFVVSYTANNAKNGHSDFKQHLAYGGSKLLSYSIIGGLFGLVGGIFAFSLALRAGVSIFAGVFMIFFALSMMGLKFFRRFQFNPKFISKVSAKASGKAKGPYKAPMIIGLLSGLFIACGPLQAMYIYAAGTGNFLTGFLSLFSFGIGTLPVMLGFGGLANIIGHKTTQRILKISAVIVLILGIIMLNRGLTVLGSPYSFDGIKSNFVGTSAGTSGIQIVGDKQVIKMSVDRTGWTPDAFVLKKGVPVRWEIDVKELTGCNKEIIVREYNLDIKLKQGLNVVEFTPTEAKTVMWSCWMGMIPGSFIVTENGQATQEQVKSVTSKPAGKSCGCGGM